MSTSPSTSKDDMEQLKLDIKVLQRRFRGHARDIARFGDDTDEEILREVLQRMRKDYDTLEDTNTAVNRSLCSEDAEEGLFEEQDVVYEQMKASYRTSFTRVSNMLKKLNIQPSFGNLSFVPAPLAPTNSTSSPSRVLPIQSRIAPASNHPHANLAPSPSSINPLHMATSSRSSWMNDLPVDQDPAVPIGGPAIQLKLQNFDGKIANWVRWSETFRILVATSNRPAAEKMLLLRQHVDDRSNRFISHYPDTPQGFKHAMLTLEEVFGDPSKQRDQFISSIKSMRPVDVENTVQFEDFSVNCLGLLRGLSEKIPVNDSSVETITNEVISKLPRSLRLQYLHVHAVEAEHPFITLGNWLRRVSNEYRTTELKPTHVKPVRMNHVNTSASTSPGCAVPGHENYTHKTTDCRRFSGMSLPDKMNLVKQKRLCFSCLKAGHMIEICSRTKKCGTDGCTGLHHPLLHDRKQKGKKDRDTSNSPNKTPESEEAHVQCTARTSKSNNSMSPVTLCSTNLSTSSASLLGIVSIRCKGDKTAVLNALIDEGSDTTFISQDAVDKLGLKPQSKATLSITGICQTYSTDTATVQFRVSRLTRPGHWFDLSAVVLRRLCEGLRKPDSVQLQKQFNHLAKLPLTNGKGPVDLVIGVDNMHLITPDRTVKGQTMQPIAQRCLLGWVVRGPLKKCQDQVNHSPNNRRVNFANSSLLEAVKRYFDSELAPLEEIKPVRPEEMKAKEIVENGVELKDGRWIAPLPWKTHERPMNNYPIASRRYENLQKRFIQNPHYQKDYADVLDDYIEKGYAEKIQSDTAAQNQFYLPHHSVKKASNNKLRIVFDSSAVHRGKCLNDYLFTGPTLQNELISLLTRFRKKECAVTSDIEGMFHQIEIKPHDRVYHRFLWQDSRDKSQSTFQMTRLIFGATSSPYIAIHCLNRSLQLSNMSCFQSSFYVDDFVSSFSQPEEAGKSCTTLKQALSKFSFNLRKWTSNMNISELNTISEPTKVLGLDWHPSPDTISVVVPDLKHDSDSSLTKRKVLSNLSSVFDPLGLFNYVTITGKLMLQSLMLETKGWDEPIGKVKDEQWCSYFAKIKSLKDLSVRRCVDMSEASNVHIFCDASIEAYGACVYVVNNDHSQLLISKVKVAPQKRQSLPRLELNSAVIGAKLADYMHQEHDISSDKIFLWTDSRITLSWIVCPSSTLPVYVGNRVGLVQTLTTGKQWRHVPGRLNPADLCTRSNAISISNSQPLWFHGPKFLLDQSSWPCQPSLLSKLEVDTELNKRPNHQASSNVTSINSFGAKCNCNFPPDVIALPLTKELLEQIRESQYRHFPMEIDLLKNKKPIPKSSQLSSLTPMLHQELLRVGGRIRNASRPYDTKHPFIISKHCILAKEVVRYCHEIDANHGSIDFTLCTIRQTFWIPKARSLVKRVRSDCITCKRMNARPLDQQMAQLPKERVTPSPPFHHSSIDLFGPFEVLEGRNKIVKRWGVIITCLFTRAVHLDVATSLSAQDFLNTFTRFCNTRGTPYSLYSDNGTNLTKAAKVLAEDFETLADTLKTKQMSHIIWRFQPAAAPHMGGVHEALVKTAKRALQVIIERTSIDKRHLRDDELRTLLSEVMGIMNRRPLALTSSDMDGADPLTPNHFLILRRSQRPAVCEYQRMKPTEHYKFVKNVYEQFCTEWLGTVLPNLLKTPRWRQLQRNVAIGDLVLIVDETTKRSEWRTGVVDEVHTGPDGLVRSAKVRSTEGSLIRPVVKLCLLRSAQEDKIENDNSQIGGEDGLD